MVIQDFFFLAFYMCVLVCVNGFGWWCLFTALDPLTSHRLFSTAGYSVVPKYCLFVLVQSPLIYVITESWNWPVNMKHTVNRRISLNWSSIDWSFVLGRKRNLFVWGGHSWVLLMHGITYATLHKNFLPSQNDSNMSLWPPEKPAKSAKQKQLNLILTPKYKVTQFLNNI